MKLSLNIPRRLSTDRAATAVCVVTLFFLSQCFKKSYSNLLNHIINKTFQDYSFQNNNSKGVGCYIKILRFRIFKMRIFNYKSSICRIRHFTIHADVFLDSIWNFCEHSSKPSGHTFNRLSSVKDYFSQVNYSIWPSFS